MEKLVKYHKKISVFILAIIGIKFLYIYPMLAYETPSSLQYIESIKDRKPDKYLKEYKNIEKTFKENSITLDINECIKEGINSNPNIEIAFQAIKEYEWNLRATKKQWFPKLELQNGSPLYGSYYNTYYSNYYKRNSLNSMNKQTIRTKQIEFQPGIAITWDIIKPTRQSQIFEAESYLKQQKMLFNISVRDVTSEIQKTYYTLQSISQLIESYKGIFAINVEQLRIVYDQTRIGMATTLDISQTEAQLYQNFDLLIQYYQSYIEQSSKLSKLIGYSEEIVIIPKTKAVKTGNWSLTLSESINTANENREEIQASMALAEAYRWSGISAIRSYLPVVELVASGTIIGTSGIQSRPDGALDNDYEALTKNTSATFGIGLSWLFYDGGIQKARSESLFSKSKGQIADTKREYLEIDDQIRSSYGKYLTSQLRIETAQREYNAAQIAEKVSRMRFKIGVGGITNVVQSIQQLSTATQNLSNSILDYNSSIVDLYRYTAIWPNSVQNKLNIF